VAWDQFFGALSDEEVGQVWARAMRELRDRQLIRSWNNPVADYAERLVSAELGLELAPPVAQGYDATEQVGRRYQVKARRLSPQNKSRQLGVIRKLDQNEFDDLIAVVFDEDLVLLEMWQIPHEVVVDFGKWVPTLNGHRIYVRSPLLDDARVKRLR
jgi:hypothetical protein